jgi:putative ABC transport system permease protein
MNTGKYLILLSFLISSPLAWYAMHSWLEAYSDRISISWQFFTLAGGGTLIITLLAISFCVVKAAIDNPVQALSTD